MSIRYHSRSVIVALGALGLTVASAGCGASAPSSSKSSTTITYEASIPGGPTQPNTVWLNKDVIPAFEKQMKAQGKNVTVKFVNANIASGTNYADRLALDLKSGGGPDVFALDGPYYGAFATAGYLKPLTSLVGPQASSWSGWSQISKTVQAITQFNGKTYGIPSGTDGRVLYYNKKLFSKAGLPTTWQPTSWADIISAAKQLKAKDPGIEALQIDGGAQMKEATTLQGWLPLLAGSGQLIYNETTGMWQGDTPAMKAVANFYHTIYSQGLANSQLQLGAKGRDQTFQLFSQGKVGIYLESPYLYESIINPGGLYPMASRNSDVGWALIPAETAGKGIRGQNFVSMSGGGGNTINPHTKHPKLAWDFLTFMNSKQAITQYVNLKPQDSARNDVNTTALASHPLLSFVAQKVLPITAYRPSLSVYPQVSSDIQTLAQNVATGKSVSSSLQTYTSTLENLVGASHVTNS